MTATANSTLLLRQLEQLPTLPAVAVAVMNLTRGDGASADDVVKLIETEPALATRILQLVHRADTGVRGSVHSVSRAVVLLGFDAVRAATLAVSVFDCFGDKKRLPGEAFDREAFWRHCLGVATAAELLASAAGTGGAGGGGAWGSGRAGSVPPGEAFLAGLLHDIGKIALDAALPKSFARVVAGADLLRGDIADVERGVVGLDHMVVGKRLAERWQLPLNLREAIWLHGQLPAALPPTVRHARLVNLITLADVLVREQHLGYSGNYTFPVPKAALLEALELTPGQVEGAMEKLVDAIEPRARALGLGRNTAGELYRTALRQANHELGRLGEQLASRNRKLAVRAKYFKALSDFQSELRPDAPPGEVLAALAQTAAALLESPAAAFSQPSPDAPTEVVLADARGNVRPESLVEPTRAAGAARSQSQSAQPAGDVDPAVATAAAATAAAATAVEAAPDTTDDDQSAFDLIRPVGPDLEPIVQAFSPQLAGGGRYWIRLEADGVTIGGVVWGAPAGEIDRLAPQQTELAALAAGWGLALRTTQIREEAKTLAEELADTNRRLQAAQSELLRTRTLTTVAEMAAGAAHEMNNPLAVISGRSQLLAASLADPRDKQAAQLIFDKSQRLSEMISELMHFARPHPPSPSTWPLGHLADEALELARARVDFARRKITLDLAVPDLHVDPRQVAGALAEVIVNAVQATDAQSGTLDLSARHDTLGRRIVLSIRDNGIGMDDHTRSHAFDPFFSNKPAGRQPGMGLSKAVRWIEMSAGSLRLESAPARGTVVVIYLPTSDAPARSSATPAPRATGRG